MSDNQELTETLSVKKAPTTAEVYASRQRLELLLTKLYNHPTDNFYAHLMLHVDRHVDNVNCPTMGVGMKNGRIKMVYNTSFLDALDDEAVTEIIKHEMLHLINDHINRGQGAKEKDMTKHKMENISQDCAINQYLDNKVIEKVGGVTLQKFRELLTHKPKDFIIEPYQTFDYYQALLQAEKDHRDQNGEGENSEGESLGKQLGEMEMDDHGQFGEMDALDRAMLEEKIKKAAEDAKSAGVGRLPDYLEELLKILKKPKVNWKRQLKQFIGAGIKADKKNTRSKRNRRYGIKFAGHKRDHVAKILVVLDTSGSMSWGNRMDSVLNELYGIWKNNPSNRLDICECDTEIKEVFTYDGKDTFKMKGGGGTNMAPALKYADSKKYDGVIVLTDGEFYEDLNAPKTRSLFVIAGNPSYTNNFGKTIHID